jgi:glyoxylase-like metal-dependent hydrolase (beta-lactamase superfamily II)
MTSTEFFPEDSQMEIKKFVLKFFDVNCYLVKYKNRSFLIDPGSEFKRIKEYILKNNIKLDFILNTHGHYDHIGAVDSLVKEFKIPFYIHEREEEIIENPKKNLSSIFSSDELLLKTCNLISGDTIDDFLNLGIKIMNFAGHSPGSIIIKIEENLFTGDVLFKGSVGRTDLPEGSSREMNNSLKIIKSFDEKLKIFPGHGPESTMKEELENNYFLRS